jgi:hypothetical protein
MSRIGRTPAVRRVARTDHDRQLEQGRVVGLAERRELVTQEGHVRQGAAAPLEVVALEGLQALDGLAGEDDGHPVEEGDDRGDRAERAHPVAEADDAERRAAHQQSVREGEDGTETPR